MHLGIENIGHFLNPFFLWDRHVFKKTALREITWCSSPPPLFRSQKSIHAIYFVAGVRLYDMRNAYGPTAKITRKTIIQGIVYYIKYIYRRHAQFVLQNLIIVELSNVSPLLTCTGTGDEPYDEKGLCIGTV